MKKISYELIPVRLGFSMSFTDQITFKEDEYNQEMNRKIFITDSFKSNYKLKSKTSMAFLEFYALNLNIGDIINVSFDIKTNKEIVIGLEQNKINKSLEVSDAVTDNLTVPNNENFQRCNIKTYVRNNYGDGIGDCFNLRLRTLDSEIELKNIEVTIFSTNLNLAINNRTIRINNKEEFEFATKFTMNNTKYRTDSYSKGYENIERYATFNEEDITLNSEDATYFKGIVTKLEKINQISVNVSFEYSSQNQFKVNLRCTGENLNRESIFKFIEPSEHISKKMIILDNNMAKKKEYVIEIGDVRAVNMMLKNIVVNTFFVGNNIEENKLYTINH